MFIINRIALGLFLVFYSVISLASAYSGSGFFITRDGYFVTNYHVIRDATDIALRDINGKLHKATIVRTDKANDIAILKADGIFSALPIGNSRTIRRGSTVITVGYPHIDVQGLEPKVSEGIVNSLSGIADAPNVFQISAPIQSGNSGGPLVSLDGNVIGVIVSKLSASEMFKTTGDMPQNVNYAIKSNYLLEVVSNVSGLEDKLTPPTNKPQRNLEDLTSYVEKATAIVFAVRDEPKTTPRAQPKPTQPKAEGQPSWSAGSNGLLASLLPAIQSGQFSSDGINIRAPDLAENGAVVPLEINLSPPLVKGDRLYVIVNDEYVSHVVTVDDHIELTKFSIRVRMPRTGLLRGVVLNPGNQMRVVTKNVRITIGADMNSTEGGGTFSHRARAQKTMSSSEVKMLMNSPMSTSWSVKEVNVRFGGYGNVNIAMTTVASKNPFIGITAVSGSYSGYEIQYVLTNGQQYIDNGSF